MAAVRSEQGASLDACEWFVSTERVLRLSFPNRHLRPASLSLLVSSLNRAFSLEMKLSVLYVAATTSEVEIPFDSHSITNSCVLARVVRMPTSVVSLCLGSPALAGFQSPIRYHASPGCVVGRGTAGTATGQGRARIGGKNFLDSTGVGELTRCPALTWSSVW